MLWRSYFIPGTGVLRNDLAITDAPALRDAEYAVCRRRGARGPVAVQPGFAGGSSSR